MRGLKSTPTTSSAPRFQSDSVSRPPAHCRWIARRQRPVQVADQVVLHRVQVGAAGADQLDRLVEPALVALGGLVPGEPVRRVHRADVGGSSAVASRTPDAGRGGCGTSGRSGVAAWRRASLRPRSSAGNREGRRPDERRPVWYLVAGAGALSAPSRSGGGTYRPDRRSAAGPGVAREVARPGAGRRVRRRRTMRQGLRSAGAGSPCAVAGLALGPFASPPSAPPGRPSGGRRELITSIITTRRKPPILH